MILETGNEEPPVLGPSLGTSEKEGPEAEWVAVGYEIVPSVWKKLDKLGLLTVPSVEHDVSFGSGYGRGYNTTGIISAVVVTVPSKATDEIGGEVAAPGILVEEGGLNGSVKGSPAKYGPSEGTDVVSTAYLLNYICSISLLSVADLSDPEPTGKFVYVVVLLEEGTNVSDVAT